MPGIHCCTIRIVCGKGRGKTQQSERGWCGKVATFDSTKRLLPDLLKDVVEGKIQLPDFQRGWVWDDDHVRGLLVSIARSFPIGAVMLLETGGEARFQVRPVESVRLTSPREPEKLILDGQQRLTSLTQAMRAPSPSTRERPRVRSCEFITTSILKRRLQDRNIWKTPSSSSMRIGSAVQILAAMWSSICRPVSWNANR